MIKRSAPQHVVTGEQQEEEEEGRMDGHSCVVHSGAANNRSTCNASGMIIEVDWVPQLAEKGVRRQFKS